MSDYECLDCGEGMGGLQSKPDKCPECGSTNIEQMVTVEQERAKELDTLRAVLAAAQERNAELELRLDAYNGNMIDVLQAEVDRLKDELNQARFDLNTVTDNYRQCQDNLQQARDDRNTQLSECDRLQHELDKAREDAHRWATLANGKANELQQAREALTAITKITHWTSGVKECKRIAAAALPKQEGEG